MQITTSELSNVVDPAQITLTNRATKSGVSIISGAVQCRLSDGRTQQTEHKPLADYLVIQLGNSILHGGMEVIRKTAGFAFSQMINSPDINAVAPGLKESMLMLATLYNLLQPAGADCRADQFQCSDKKCVSAKWQCDGERDCVNGLDERQCTQKKCEELKRDFRCDGGRCISAQWLCNGGNDCDDTSDESRITCTQEKCEELKRFICDQGKCLPHYRVCDGERNCYDGSDESNLTCTSASTTTVLSSGRFSDNTGETTPESRDGNDAWVAAPVIIAIAVVVAALGLLYLGCAYRSYRVHRLLNPDASRRQLVCNALKNPLSFRQPQYPHKPENVEMVTHGKPPIP